MFDAIVVGLLISGIAAGVIGVLSAWYQNRSFRARGLPPLILVPQPATPVEPTVGSVIRPSPLTAPLNGGNAAKAPRAQSPPTFSESSVFDDLLSALEPSYEIIRALGCGETSVVYLARERASNDEVAIKLIRSKYFGDEEAFRRFALEARLLERLVHPNIVRVRAVLELGDAGLAIVMAYVPGRTLEELIRNDGRLAPERAERFTRDIASALGAAHAMGIVHRDVKPENVFVDLDDRPLLTDFSLARSKIRDSQLTLVGVAIGTPEYMAPEQIDGGSDARGDVYSLGLVAWEMLSGRRPWEGESFSAILHHQRYDQLRDVRDLRDDVPDPFAKAIAVAIEKDPNRRWQNTAQMIAGLGGSPSLQNTSQRPSLSADTVGFSGSAAFEFIAAELEAQNTELVSKTRRRHLLAMGGVAAVMTIVAVAAKVRGSNDVRRAPAPLPSDFVVNDSAGGSLNAIQTVASPSQKTLFRKGATKTDTKTDTRTHSKTAGNSDSKKSITTAHKAADTRPDKPTSAPAVSVEPLAGPSPSRVTIAAGGLHSCMVNAEGRAYCWGSNARGQLSAGGANSEATPLAVAGDVRFTAIATGLAHSCAIARSGTVWCWGENEHGQLGDRSTQAHPAPTRVADTSVFTAVGVGVAHSCVLDSQSEALCWGSSAHGQLGSESSANDIGAPTLVAGGHHYSSIAVGWNFACALDGGRAFCWGENADGQLGDGSITDRRVPVPVAGGLAFRSIAAGASHACGIAVRGEAYCWGKNSGGQLGDGTRASHEVPTAVKTSLRFVAIATGALHTCAVTTDGEAFCWGRDNYGQLGDGGNTQDSAEPVRVLGNHSFAAIRAFGSHTCATTSSGEVFCWGYNQDGQLGDGSRVNRARPVYVEPPTGK
jgi:serine/threonine protein kinase/alpha-tubulin suppressor-like RCC1 family protein